MRSKTSKVLKISAFAIAVLSVAAAPVKNDLVELSGFLNARTEAKFRTSDKNKIYSLQPGTKAVIQEVKHFHETGNYGLCLKIVNADVSNESPCYWVYYVPSRPTMKLLNIDANSQKGEALLKEWTGAKNQVAIESFKHHSPKLKEVKNPERATAAEIIKVTPTIRDPQPRHGKIDVTDLGAESMATSVAAQANLLNRLTSKTFDSAPETKDCTICSTKIPKYEECSAKNNYFENEMDQLNSRDPQNLIFSLLKTDTPARYVKDICFASSLRSFGGPFKYCGPGDHGSPQKSVNRACVSERYNKLVRNSFEAVADCLGDYLSGKSETAHDSMIDIFGLMTIESGLHVNARSKTMYDSEGNVRAGGAGGAGQLTQGAIQAINGHELRLMREHLAESRNPTCQLLETTLKKPMKDKFSQSCDRISFSSGNPLKNMMYTVAYQKQSRFSIRKYHLESSLSEHIFASLSTGDKDYLERQLGIWAHNAGDGALHLALRSYLRGYQGKDLSSRQDIKNFLGGMRPHMRRASSGRVNPDEPVNFWHRIQKRMDDLNNNAGDGTCVVGQK